MARRGRGGGSTPRLKADGRWEASYYDRTGKRRWVTTAKDGTRRDCQRLLREALSHRDAGYTDDRQTVGGWVDRWADTLAPPKYRPATVRNHRYRLSLLPDWFRQVPLWELDALDVERMLGGLLATHSTSTVAGVRSVLRRCLGAAENAGRVSRNAARLADPVHVVEDERQPLTLDEAKALLQALEGDRLQSLYLVALSCGLRQSEAIGLRWAKVDLDGAGALRIDTQITPYGEVPPKTRRSIRTVPLPEVCIVALNRWRRLQLEERLRLGPAYEDDGLVWPDEAGRPLKHRNLRRHLQRTCEQAGIRRARFHELRHSAATLLLAQGVPARVVMATLGHSAAAMLVKYAHVTEELARDAADAADRVFGEEQ